MLGDGVRLTIAGTAIGLAGALGGTRVVEHMLFEVSATDPPTFLAVAFLLVAVALTASVVPAVRATRADPLRALRSDWPCDEPRCIYRRNTRALRFGSRVRL